MYFKNGSILVNNISSTWQTVCHRLTSSWSVPSGMTEIWHGTVTWITAHCCQRRHVDVLYYYCNRCTVHLLLFCTLTNKWGTLLVAQPGTRISRQSSICAKYRALCYIIQQKNVDPHTALHPVQHIKVRSFLRTSRMRSQCYADPFHFVKAINYNVI